MAKRDKYHPDYKKLYPGEEITPEVLESLKRSDRKMEYMEVDLKQGSFRQHAAEFAYSREISLDQLRDEEEIDFLSPSLSPEEIAVHIDEIDRLYRKNDAVVMIHITTRHNSVRSTSKVLQRKAFRKIVVLTTYSMKNA